MEAGQGAAPLGSPPAPSTGKKPSWVAQDPQLFGPPYTLCHYNNTAPCQGLEMQKHTRGDGTLAPSSCLLGESQAYGPWLPWGPLVQWPWGIKVKVRVLESGSALAPERQPPGALGPRVCTPRALRGEGWEWAWWSPLC